MISKVQGGHQYTYTLQIGSTGGGGRGGGSGNYSLVLQDNLSLIFPRLGSGT